MCCYMYPFRRQCSGGRWTACMPLWVRPAQRPPGRTPILCADSINETATVGRLLGHPRQGGGTGGSSATGGRPIQRAALFPSLPALLLVGPCAYRGRPWDPTLETEATGDQADGVWVLLGAISRYHSAGDRLLLNEGLSRRGWVSQNPVTAHGPAPRWLLDQSISRMGDSEYVRGLPSDVLPDNRPPTPPLCTGET